MLYIGHRPTLREYKNRTIEVNIFGFNKDIYGDKLQLEMVERIRDDMQFEKMEELQNSSKKKRPVCRQEENPGNLAGALEEKMSQYPGRHRHSQLQRAGLSGTVPAERDGYHLPQLRGDRS